MSYFRGDQYVWTDGADLHLWSTEDYSPLNEDYPAGVSIPESVMDQFAVMRFAELLSLGLADAVVKSAIENANFGGEALRKHHVALLDFIAGFEQKRHS